MVSAAAWDRNCINPGTLAHLAIAACHSDAAHPCVDISARPRPGTRPSDAVLRRVEIVERGIAEIELVTENEDKMANRSRCHFAILRQRSEQYFTSFQVFAHLRRHTIGRPQTTHSLLGRVDLLPG